MEMTYNVVDAVWQPKLILKYHEIRETSCIRQPPWTDSPLNPKNRPNSLEIYNSIWRIDGATGCGTRFYAVPLDSLHNITPLRIFVYLPDQGDYPPALRTCLDSALSVPLRDGKAIASLGISKHLCRALHYQCARDPGFLRRYQQLPFGSRLVFDNIAPNVADMRLTVVANYEHESRSLSLPTLRRLWAKEVAEDAWPPVINITRLHLVRQMHDTVSVVKLHEDDRHRLAFKDEMVVFKSGIGRYDHVYHELRFYLTAAPHQHIMPCPLGLVVKRSAFGGKLGVLGFLLKYFPCGSIRDILPARQRAGTLSNRTKLHWCRQVISALVHIKEKCNTFFSDLRPDNVLLDDAGGHERLLLCDFEQRGNWHEWSAPEVYYRQYVENIRAELAGKTIKDTRLETLLDKYACAHVSPTAYTPAETPVQAKNRAWFALSPESQEKASVYSFGLFLYTVFEGQSNVRRNIMNKWPNDPEVEFPEFKLTPLVIRDIVMRCVTIQEESLLPPQAKRVVRVGGLLYPEGQAFLNQDTDEAINSVLETALRWWSTELTRAEKFTESPEWISGCFGSSRPTLTDVMHSLESLVDDDI
ncbi:hypothetical protein F5X99DRAFT_128942 [Biscogniauxia marginata]|nr:hypothetical protein F5X99DRAFT_128942 [Biscogniauxia marginata]